VVETGTKQKMINLYFQLTDGNFDRAVFPVKVKRFTFPSRQKKKSGNGGILAAGAGLGILSGIFNAAKKQG